MRGFVLIDLLITMGLFLSLLVFTVPNLIGSQRRTIAGDTLTRLVSDMREQQLKTMLGDSDGVDFATAAGIYFEPDRYTLFRGSSYNPASQTNFVINLDPGMQFSSTNFPSSSVVYNPGSGEIGNFVSDVYDLSLTDTSLGLSQHISVNRYGVIISVN